jgi:hypothetical protein
MTFRVTRLFSPGARAFQPAAPTARPTVTMRTFAVPAAPSPDAPTEAGCRACAFFLSAHELCRQPFATCPSSPRRHRPWLNLRTCPQRVPRTNLPPDTLNP